MIKIKFDKKFNSINLSLKLNLFNALNAREFNLNRNLDESLEDTFSKLKSKILPKKSLETKFKQLNLKETFDHDKNDISIKLYNLNNEIVSLETEMPGKMGLCLK